MRTIFIVILSLITSISQSYAMEYICSFDSMLTGDVNRYSSNYRQLSDVKAKSKFVFDITARSLIVNGEEYVTVSSSVNKNGFFVYSNKDFPYIMFYFYPSEKKIIMIGMQESHNDTFLKSDSLNCHSISDSENYTDRSPASLDFDSKIPGNQQENPEPSYRNQSSQFIDDQYKHPTNRVTPNNPLEMQEIIIPPPR